MQLLALRRLPRREAVSDALAAVQKGASTKTPTMPRAWRC
jgi:hypothetical protein